MLLTQQELDLKMLAVARIRDHVLPAQVPERIWAGEGSGEKCSLCDRIIEKTETEYELDASAPPAANAIVRLHLQCHALWQVELARMSEQAGTHE